MEISISEPQSPQSFDSIDGQESSKDLFVIYGHPTDLIPPYSDWIDWQQPIPSTFAHFRNEKTDWAAGCARRAAEGRKTLPEPATTQ